MALRLVLKNAAAASGSRTFFTGPFRLVSAYAQPAGEQLLSRGLEDTTSFSGHRDLFSDGFLSIHPFSSRSAMARSTPSSFSGSKGSEAPAAISDQWYRWKDEKNSVCLKADMPGFDKDNVKVTVEENKLVISGEGDQETDAETYSLAFLLKPNIYKLDGIKAGMKNGVLKVTVPKVQDEERKVKNINVE